MLIDPFTRRPSTYTTADAHFCKPFQFVCHQFVIAFDKPSHYSTAIDRVLHIYSHMSLDEFVCIVDCIVCSFVRSFAPLVGHWPMCNMIFLINTKASPCHLATIDSLSLSPVLSLNFYSLFNLQRIDLCPIRSPSLSFSSVMEYSITLIESPFLGSLFASSCCCWWYFCHCCCYLSFGCDFNSQPKKKSLGTYM